MDQLRLLLQTALGRVLAARGELAALGQIQRVRDRAGDRFKPFVAGGIQTRDGEHQALGIRMGILVLVEDRPGGCVFDDLAAVHDRDVVGHLVDDAEIVRDEQNGGAVFLTQLVHELQDLRLNGHVERRGRLVRDQQLRTAGQRHGDHDTLPHTAGELVRILLGDDLGVRDLDVGQQLDRFRGSLLFVHALMDHERLGDLPADGEDRVQARHRLLEDHGDLVAADLVHFVHGQLGQILTVEEDLAGVNIAVAVEQTENAHGRDALAGTGFADDAEHLARVKRIADAVDRLDRAALGCEESLQIL